MEAEKEQPVVLVLTRQQAQWLMDITGRAIIGSGRRFSCCDPIYKQLRELGFRCGVEKDWRVKEEYYLMFGGRE